MHLNARWTPVVYFVLGQVGWFACVMSAARGASYIGITVALVLVGLHLLRVDARMPEVKLLSVAVLLGGAWESAVMDFGLLAYPAGSAVHGVAPLWLPALWAVFAAQINTTYRWLKTRPKAAILLGAVAGPVSFHAGAALGALRFAMPLAATLTLACGWAVLLPSIVLLSRRWDGVQAGVQARRA